MKIMEETPKIKMKRVETQMKEKRKLGVDIKGIKSPSTWLVHGFFVGVGLHGLEVDVNEIYNHILQCI